MGRNKKKEKAQNSLLAIELVQYRFFFVFILRKNIFLLFFLENQRIQWYIPHAKPSWGYDEARFFFNLPSDPVLPTFV